MADIPTLFNFIKQFQFGSGKDREGNSRLAQIDKHMKDVGNTMAGMATARSSSIKYQAKDLIAQYPVLVSDNITENTVQLANKAFEHEYVNILKFLIQNDDTEVDYNKTSTYLRKFHNNISHDVNSNSILTSAADEGVKTEGALNEANQELMTAIAEDLNHNILNEETINLEMFKLLKEDKDNDGDDDDPEVVTSAKANIDNVEIKKANNLAPTNVSVEINTSHGNKRTISFGVKCVSHLIKSEDIEHYLPNSIITRTPLMRLIQFTTGEIKFFKDFMFAVDELKMGAVKGNNGSTFWWRKLQTISKVAHARPALFGLKTKGKPQNAPIPITTMIISKENVDNIRHRHGIDILNKPAHVAKIMRNFFLMNFAIVDESIETIYIFNEETKNYSVYPFKALESQAKQKNIDIKDIYSLLK
jgi:hypothetical protein